MTGMITALAILVGVILGLCFFPFLFYVVVSMVYEPKTQADAEQVVADFVTREKARLWDKLEAIMEPQNIVHISRGHAPESGEYNIVVYDGNLSAERRRPVPIADRHSHDLAGAVIGAHYELTKEADA